jgi:hypothetical protein
VLTRKTSQLSLVFRLVPQLLSRMIWLSWYVFKTYNLCTPENIMDLVYDLLPGRTFVSIQPGLETTTVLDKKMVLKPGFDLMASNGVSGLKSTELISCCLDVWCCCGLCCPLHSWYVNSQISNQFQMLLQNPNSYRDEKAPLQVELVDTTCCCCMSCCSTHTFLLEWEPLTQTVDDLFSSAIAAKG